MTETGNHKRLLLVLTILTLGFIWGNSLMPGTESGAFSDWVSQQLSRIFGGMVNSESGRGVLRKLAHGTEYLVLGVELWALVYMQMERSWSLVLLCGTMAALIDETIQLFVEGRSGAVRDVWIDLGGFCVGCAVCMCAVWYLRRKRE